jgi:hypothetical protein
MSRNLSAWVLGFSLMEPIMNVAESVRNAYSGPSTGSATGTICL